MMSHLKVIRNTRKHSFIAVAGLVALAGTSAAADTDTNTALTDSYTWSAQLVDFDEATRMVTVKARMVGSEMDAVQVFEPGDRVLLTWSGITSGTGVRAVSHAPFAEDARLTMPVEFVSFDDDHRYVTYCVQVPPKGVERLASLKPGEWVTAATPYEATLGEQAVAMIRPYVTIG